MGWPCERIVFILPRTNYETTYHSADRRRLLLLLGLLGGCQAANNGTFEVRNFGARGDGKLLDTSAVNDAISAASKSGGGTVHFTAGNYISAIRFT